MPGLLTVRHNLVIALLLQVFVIFSFVVAILATFGAFAGGSTPHTPLVAQAYLAIGLVLTIAGAIRTKTMLDALDRGDIGTLKRLNSGLWVGVAWVFSAILPAIYLSTAAAGIRNLA